MFCWIYVALLYPLLATAKLQLHITASPNENNTKVFALGDSVELISDLDRNTFQLADKPLKQSVEKYFGKEPDDAFLRSPTPWGDLYKTYGWDQVNRHLKLTQINDTKTTKNEVVVIRNEFQNNSTKPTEYDAAVSTVVENLVINKYSSLEFSGENNVEYFITIEPAEIGSSSSFQYDGTFGKSGMHKENVVLGQDTNVKVVVQPEQRVVVELRAIKGKMQVKLDYEAYLRGYTAVNYARKYKDHHFWALSIEDVMKSNNINNRLKAYEDLEVTYYSDARLTVRDMDTREMLLEKIY